MDFNSSPGPLLAYRPPSDGGHFITDWKWWLETAGNFALVGAGGALLQRGKTFATSFKLLPTLPQSAKLLLPFSIWVEQPGVLHLALDVIFYKGTGPAFEWTESQYKAAREWFEKVDEAGLVQAIGRVAFDQLTGGGAITDLRAIFEMPPAWLTDP